MREERMMILRLLEEGKVNAEEAVHLLETVNNAYKGRASEVFDTVKEKVTKFAKDAEPKVKSAAGKVMDKSVEIGNTVKKKVDDKINESKYKDKIYDAKEKAEDIIDDVVDEVKDLFEEEPDAEPTETVDADETAETEE